MPSFLCAVQSIEERWVCCTKGNLCQWKGELYKVDSLSFYSDFFNSFFIFFWLYSITASRAGRGTCDVLCCMLSAVRNVILCGSLWVERRCVCSAWFRFMQIQTSINMSICIYYIYLYTYINMCADVYLIFMLSLFFLMFIVTSHPWSILSSFDRSENMKDRLARTAWG